MKVGIIRCMQTEDYCPGSVDFAAIRNRKGAFSHVDANENIEVVGFVSCGGCPGKKILMRSRELQKRRRNRFSLMYHCRHPDRLCLSPCRENQGYACQ